MRTSLPYKKKEDGIIDAFKEGTTWDDIYDLYVFDRKLRLLVFDAIERLIGHPNADHLPTQPQVWFALARQCPYLQSSERSHVEGRQDNHH